MRKGLVSRIERFSLHDGQGIRTLVVMKGCPLRCKWCSSPHTQEPRPEMLHIRGKCAGCGKCIEACPQKAISHREDLSTVLTDRVRCDACGECIQACVNRARELSGRWYTAEALFGEVEKDAAFYRRSRGGVTVGGGEPTAQSNFIGEFLSLCRSHYLHTAMETTAFVSWDRLAPILSCLDLVYIDLKQMDTTKHAQWTGVSNGLILENIVRTAKTTPLILRMPVVPGFNDDAVNIMETAKFAKQIGSKLLRLELLPYHPFGLHKYAELDRAYALESTEPLPEEQMIGLRDMARSVGIEVEIGG